jgi:alkylhydroperoxidase family enzyme
VSPAVPPIGFDDLPAELAELLRPRYERLGYLGGFFQCAAHQPETLAGFVRFSEAAKDDLPANLVELIALTAARMLHNPYEANQHERLAVRLGLGRDWVESVETLLPDRSGLSAREALVQRYVLAALPVCGRGAETAGLVAELVEELGVPETVAVVLLAARYLAHSLVVNSLGVEPPVPSIWEDGFGA